ncbi:hypothetical protein [Sandaracinus amylolyticus]|uniref:Uncharacterized protein n=1 Tax=Sandaracinus amylolyticus TaxID=927083 RepID=A0A0F6WA64_9BACT|nr:hypothetical protein [Sandaracinus amylolyticus]AKF11362.1 hypothetical protein DB32_008511 [Sandaracinus amylolyticus]
MAYREPSASEVELDRRVIVAWRGVVMATVVTVVSVITAMLAHPIALGALIIAYVALAKTASHARWVAVHVRGMHVVIRERALFRREVVRELDASDVRRVGTDERCSTTILAADVASVELTTADGSDFAITSHLLGASHARALASRIAEHFALGRTTVRERPCDPSQRAHRRLGWVGVLPVLVIVGIAWSISAYREDASEGRLALVCRERCVFGGITCLPGGTLEGSYAPGSYAVALEDRVVQVPVVAGHRTTFECRHDAGIPTPVPDR